MEYLKLGSMDHNALAKCESKEDNSLGSPLKTASPTPFHM